MAAPATASQADEEAAARLVEAVSSDSGEKQMRMLRRLPKILRFIPGKAQDLRAWFLVDAVLARRVGRQHRVDDALPDLALRHRHEGGAAARPPRPSTTPMSGSTTPTCPAASPPIPPTCPAERAGGTVGLLMMRSYILSGDTAHYDAVIRALRGEGHRVLPAFAGGLDGRPAIEKYFRDEAGATIDALLSLTGFSLVGGPGLQRQRGGGGRSEGARRALHRRASAGIPDAGAMGLLRAGLGPIETTMLIALPEIDGATNPRLRRPARAEPCQGCRYACHAEQERRDMAPCPERIDSLAERVERQAACGANRTPRRRWASCSSASRPMPARWARPPTSRLREPLQHAAPHGRGRLRPRGPPESVEALRAAVLEGNARQYGQEANVAAHVSADAIVRRTRRR